MAGKIRVVPSVADSWHNLKQIRSPRDAWRALVNWSYRPRRHQNCCGNYGDPGC